MQQAIRCTERNCVVEFQQFFLKMHLQIKHYLPHTHTSTYLVFASLYCCYAQISLSTHRGSVRLRMTRSFFSGLSVTRTNIFRLPCPLFSFHTHSPSLLSHTVFFLPSSFPPPLPLLTVFTEASISRLLSRCGSSSEVHKWKMKLKKMNTLDS